jgi:hypothetical protein
MKNYRVLGDDLAISDPGLAEHYLHLCKEIGIPIGLPKSFTSVEGFLNFANQTLLRGVNLSALSLKEEISIANPAMRREQLSRMFRRG